MTVEITKYTDYVPFITDLIEYKRENGRFSYRTFCRKAGFKSPSYIKWVMDGVRPISLRSVHKFVLGLSLNKRDAQYFTLMVNYKETKDADTKRFYYEQMLSWQQKRIGSISKDAYEYLSHWYYVAIRELVASPEFNEDPRWIRERLSGDLMLSEIKNGLETLERLKLIVRDENGRLKQTERDLHTEKEVMSLAAYSFHLEMLDLAQKALTTRSAEDRDFQSLVAMIDRETYVELKDRTERFQKELSDYLEKRERTEDSKKSGQELYALNIQLLPLSVRESRKSTRDKEGL